MKIDGVYVFKGKSEGPTVAVFAGVHGNEKAGVYALESLVNSLSIEKGKVYLVFANPDAIKSNVRMINKNLNRCFFISNEGDLPEDIRARELMAILDSCDALLDIHMFYGDGEPFIICEDNALDVAGIFDVSIVSTNWSETEPGATDGYMYSKNKVGVCLECGPISESKERAEYAKDAIFRFLNYYGILSYSALPVDNFKTLIRAEKTIYRSSEEFELNPGFKNFDELQSGQIIAKEGDKKFVAGKGECIIFPHYTARIGEESYILGKKLYK